MQAARGAPLSSSGHDDTHARRRPLALFFTVALVAWTVDVVTKVIAVERLSDRDPVPVLGDFLQLTLVRNPGAAFSTGTDPSKNHAPRPAKRSEEFSVAVYNVENLYDFRDDPFDGCDFAGNSGCTGVSPPFDYVPASEADYQAQLGDLADQIIKDLHSPDLLLIQEAEDQDICTVSGDRLVCGDTNNADGAPDTLQDLALRIKAAGGTLLDEPADRHWGVRMFQFKDLDGFKLGVSTPLAG